MVGTPPPNSPSRQPLIDPAAAARAAAAALAANNQNLPPAPRAMAAPERTVTSIPCDNFRSGIDDPADWFEIYESALVVATGVTDDARKLFLLRTWLPLKLDARARDVFKNCTKVAWDELKAEFISLLIDPQEKYRWRAGQNPIVWDGVESFHALATRVKSAVKKHEKRVNWEDEFFSKFRGALPHNYRKAIDLGCDEDELTIENAKKCALRLQTALADKGKDTPAAEKTVAFSGAAMSDDRDRDRLKGLEMNFQEMSLQVGNLSSDVKKLTEVALAPSEDGRRSPSRGRDADSRDYRRRDDYDRGRNRQRYDDRDSGFDRYDSRRDYSRDQSRRSDYGRDYSRGRRSFTPERRDYRDNSRYRRDSRDDRGRRDSRDRRDSRNRRDNRDRRDRDSRDSRDRGDRDRRDSRDRRDRRGNEDSDRSRRDSRDRQDSRDRRGRTDDRNNHDRNDRGRSSNRQDDAAFRLASLQDPHLQWLYAAVAEKGQRDSKN